MTTATRVRPILLVEDNPMDVDLTLEAFAEQHIPNPVAVCRDGEEALQYVAEHGSASDALVPSLVLLDLQLPKVDGLEVLRRLRSHDVWKQIPVIVLTTSRERADIAAAYRLGVNSYIVKPVDFLEFGEVVEAIKAYWLLLNEPPFPHDHGC
jgi:CheY-like chemotaxis protein